MPITDLLVRNAELYGNDVALVEVNPEITETRRVTWKEYELIEPDPVSCYRREITWAVFNEKANRFANMLLERGVRKGDKVGILLMNCLEWLPIYFGILKTGALAVPLNFRYTADEIKYCLDLAEVDVLMFGPEFIGRVEEIAEEISKTACFSTLERAAPLLPNIMTAMSPTAPVSPPILYSRTMTMLPFTFLRVLPDSRKLYYIITKVLCTPPLLNKIITVRAAAAYSSAFLHSTIRALKCTGSEACSQAAKRFSLKA